jgi:hypothetical protein
MTRHASKTKIHVFSRVQLFKRSAHATTPIPGYGLAPYGLVPYGSPQHQFTTIEQIPFWGQILRPTFPGADKYLVISSLSNFLSRIQLLNYELGRLRYSEYQTIYSIHLQFQTYEKQLQVEHSHSRPQRMSFEEFLSSTEMAGSVPRPLIRKIFSYLVTGGYGEVGYGTDGYGGATVILSIIT